MKLPNHLTKTNEDNNHNNLSSDFHRPKKRVNSALSKTMNEYSPDSHHEMAPNASKGNSLRQARYSEGAAKFQPKSTN